MASAERAAKGWRAIWYIRQGGKRHRRSHTPRGGGFPTKEAALAYGRDQESDVRRGRYIDPSKGKILFSDFSPRWLSARGGQPSTRQRRESRMNSQLLPQWGEWELAGIEDLDVQEWVTGLAAKGYTKVYVTACLTDFSNVLQQAVKGKLILENPAKGIKAQGKASRPKVALTMPEALIFFRAFQGADRDLVEAMFATGCRWGEISGVRRRSVSPGKNVVRIAPGDVLSSGDGGMYESEGKTVATARVVKLPTWGASAFARAMQHPGEPDDRVFRNRTGGLLIRTNFQRDIWDPAKDLLAAIDPDHFDEYADDLPDELARYLRPRLRLLETLQEKLENLTPHSARHTNATWRVADGTDMATLMDQMGWDHLSSAMPYFHVNDETRDKSAKGLETLYQSAGTSARARQGRSSRRRTRRRPTTPTG